MNTIMMKTINSHDEENDYDQRIQAEQHRLNLRSSIQILSDRRNTINNRQRFSDSLGIV